MNLESRTQNVGFCWSSRRTWISASSDKRKNPSREGSGVAKVEITETEETLMAAWPVWVNPNRSKSIIARGSEEIFSFFISPVVNETRQRRRRRRKGRGNFVILKKCKRRRVRRISDGSRRRTAMPARITGR